MPGNVGAFSMEWLSRAEQAWDLRLRIRDVLEGTFLGV